MNESPHEKESRVKLSEFITKLEAIKSQVEGDPFVLIELGGPQSHVYAAEPQYYDAQGSFPCMEEGDDFMSVILAVED